MYIQHPLRSNMNEKVICPNLILYILERIHIQWYKHPVQLFALLIIDTNFLLLKAVNRRNWTTNCILQWFFDLLWWCFFPMTMLANSISKVQLYYFRKSSWQFQEQECNTIVLRTYFRKSKRKLINELVQYE